MEQTREQVVWRHRGWDPSAVSGDSRALHVVSSDSPAASLRMGGVPGDVLVWLDELYAGPVPAGLTDAARREMRAAFWAAVWECDIAEVRAMWEAQDAALERFRGYEEVVLWAAAGLRDQLLLIRHLDWFAAQEMGATRLSLICVGEFRGRSRKLYKLSSMGVFNADDLRPLLPTRREVTPGEYSVARDAWAAFRSPDPTAIEGILSGDISAIPYLHEALLRYLELFPSVRNGLGRVKNQALSFMLRRRVKLARVVGDLMIALNDGCGDQCLAWRIEELSRGRAPAVKLGKRPSFPNGHTWRLGASVGLTDVGRDLLAGRADWIHLNGIDRWLGGVHLQGEEAAWRWDEDVRRLVAMR